ncbi:PLASMODESMATA CALLOSE-BINDING PROTEIN 4-like [Triticum urartu]|uniref:X8 domain-containing protein n=1 Tax=Triticum urartu TaxID=4572 RepID=A0A8R7K4S1_TRIUA|nr:PLASMODESMATA CALLOSE-BINDING PROTEIN 4-like [Triticum urartu]
MAVPLVLVLLVAMFTGSDAMYCVCKSDANPAAMQKAIDYACGKGADCTQITSSGPCFQPSSVVAHCSYACNSYYQKNAGMGATCDFMGVATLVAADPSAGSCKYPASASGVGTGAGTGGTGMGTGGTGMGTGGMGTGTGSTGTGTGVSTGGMGSMTPPGATSTGMPGSPFGGGAYGPSGMNQDYNAAAVGRRVASAGLLVAAAAPLLLHLI